jgi:hypothetical protein
MLKVTVPIPDDLQYLAHVRQSIDSKDNVENEFSVIIGNRLPGEGINTVFLVSLMDLFSDRSGKLCKEVEGTIRLICLKGWKFRCKKEKDPEHNFNLILKRLDAGAKGNYSFRLPPIVEGVTTERYFERGFVPMTRYTQTGTKTICWYHGPLLPLDVTIDHSRSLPMASSNDLFELHKETGMYDTSYAAAWELGRLMALKDRHFSLGLKNWKSQYDNYLITREQLNNTHLPFNMLTAAVASKLPESQQDWLVQLGLLRNLPFNYLVPDEGMLPNESIRFFSFDRFWVASLIDGATSLGRVPSVLEKERNRYVQYFKPIADRAITGFMLRSTLVSDFPGLLADGFAVGDLPCKKLRRENLAKNVILCLFEGGIQKVELYPAPGMLHFGFDVSNERYRITNRGSGETFELAKNHWRLPDKRVLNILAIKEGMKCDNSAEFAFQMVSRISKFQFRC